MKRFIAITLFAPLTLSICAACSAPASVTAEPTPPPADKTLNICVVGDSITHNGTYLRNIELYMLTRYPETPTRWYNCGLGGETARRYFTILEEDLYAKNPDKVIIMFGMNDLNLELYGRNPESNRKSKDSAINGYQNAMRALVEDITAHGVGDITLLVPSPFDNALEKSTMKNCPGYNDALQSTKTFLEELAAEYGCAVVDMNTPLAAYNQAYRDATGEDVTVIGSDRIHPGTLGAWLMAYCYIDQMNLREELAGVQIDAAAKKVTAIAGAGVTGIKTKNGSLTFTYNPWRLPFYPSDDYELANTLAPLTQRYNRELLSIINLEPGQYQLLAKNTTDLGTYSADELAAGMNLFEAKLNPNRLAAQSLYRVAEDLRKEDENLRRIRILQLYIALRKLDINDPDEMAQGVAYFKESGGDFEKWLVQLYETYPIDGFEALLDEYREKMLTMNKPVSYEITVKKVD